MESIAICITVHNRNRIFEDSLRYWEKFKPENSTIFVVDDASLIPITSNFRFEKNVGIAKAKNKCLELSEQFDHIFLVDDDVRPIKNEWEIPYINSGMNHLCLTFEKNNKGRFVSPSIRKKEEKGHLVYYTAPNGCMLYLKQECLKVAGGMRPEFGLWGFEHVEYTQRIHNMGLTPEPFMDVKDSTKLFDILDWRGAVHSSLSESERRASGRENLKLYEKYINSSEYVSFKQ
jgi:glycosyltransferase involved in cell wall biosynthesis